MIKKWKVKSDMNEKKIYVLNKVADDFLKEVNTSPDPQHQIYIFSLPQPPHPHPLPPPRGKMVLPLPISPKLLRLALVIAPAF